MVYVGELAVFLIAYSMMEYVSATRTLISVVIRNLLGAVMS